MLICYIITNYKDYQMKMEVMDDRLIGLLVNWLIS